jgi:hypothetical protein
MNQEGMPDQPLYEKCAGCHLFIEPMNEVLYDHLHRGDDADEAIIATHEAKPSGMVATLTTWRAHGPAAMRERFT